MITIDGVHWTVEGSIPDGLVITGEATTTGGGKLEVQTIISIKRPAAGASVSKDVKVISENRSQLFVFAFAANNNSILWFKPNPTH
jgi:hypothetical protein